MHSWLRRWQVGGLAGLTDRSHRPRSCPHQMGAEVEASVCELRRQHPGWGPQRLVHELAGRGVVAVPSRSGVYRALVRNGLIQPGVRRRRRADYRRWERGQPMQLWQMDVMGELRLAGGRPAMLAPLSHPGPVRVTRRVHKVGTVTVAGQKFRLGTCWAGQLVTVQVDAALFHVYSDGVLLKTVPRTTRNQIIRFGPTRPPGQRADSDQHQPNPPGQPSAQT